MQAGKVLCTGQMHLNCEIIAPEAQKVSNRLNCEIIAPKAQKVSNRRWSEHRERNRREVYLSSPAPEGLNKTADLWHFASCSAHTGLMACLSCRRFRSGLRPFAPPTVTHIERLRRSKKRF